MDQTERQVIDDLFGKLRQAEQQTGPRDAQAEQHIKGILGSQPAAPYYMAQAILVQEQAIQAAQSRIQQLEGELSNRPAGGGGFLGGLFGGGGGQPQRLPAPPVTPQMAQFQRYQQQGYQQGGMGGMGGGGFLAGAMQTAMGVAGGVVLGNLLMSAFDGGEAMAADAVSGVTEALPDASQVEDEVPQVDDYADAGMDEEF